MIWHALRATGHLLGGMRDIHDIARPPKKQPAETTGTPTKGVFYLLCILTGLLYGIPVTRPLVQWTGSLAGHHPGWAIAAFFAFFIGVELLLTTPQQPSEPQYVDHCPACERDRKRATAAKTRRT